MVGIRSRRFTVGWYTDELGRRRPITRRGIVIELPPIDYEKLFGAKRKGVIVGLSITIPDATVDELEALLGFKRVEVEGAPALELEGGLKMHVYEWKEEDGRSMVHLTLDGEVDNLLTLRTVIRSFHESVKKICSTPPLREDQER